MNAAKMIREDYLQQNAFDEVEICTSFSKQVALLTNILTLIKKVKKALELELSQKSWKETVARDRIARKVHP